MPLRLVFALRLGPPQACFRIAFRPGALDWPQGFAALEATVANTIFYMSSLAPEARGRLLRGEIAPPESLIPRCGDRPGAIDVSGHETPDGGIQLLVRGSFRFRWWPLGEWVVLDGLQFDRDGNVQPFPSEELAEAW